LRCSGSFGHVAPAYGQASDTVLDTTVCDIVASPATFDGKLVRLKARTMSPSRPRFKNVRYRNIQIEDSDPQCTYMLWLTYSGSRPEATSSSGEANTGATERPAVISEEDEQLKLFKDYLAARMYPISEGVSCRTCTRYEVRATLTGRVDYFKTGGKGLDAGRETRFVLQSVADVAPHDLAGDYDPKEYSTQPVKFPRGYITGKLLDPKGKPLISALVELSSTVSVPQSMAEFQERTDENGQFNFTVPPGWYVLGINLYAGPSPELPYKTTYLPHTTDRDSARVIRLRVDQHVDHLTMQLGPAARLHERTYAGKVLWPDGRAASEAFVSLTDADQSGGIVKRASSGKTDAEGNFALIGFEREDYFVHGRISVGGKAVCAEKVRVNSTAQPDGLNLRLTIEGAIPCIQQ
jgi:hypothetical protein